MAAPLPLPAALPRPTEVACAPSCARRRPEETLLHEVVREQLETFLCRAREPDCPLPRFVERELRGYLECGILECLELPSRAPPIAPARPEEDEAPELAEAHFGA